MESLVNQVEQIQLKRPALIDPHHTYKTVTDVISGHAESKPTSGWLILLLASGSLVLLLVTMLGDLLWTGVGVWGNNNPVGWGFDIVNFVFWVGVAHAGTLISAIFLLFRQKWRSSITRTAEALTVFAMICGGIYPALHVGRTWVVHYFFPIPNQMYMWPNFRSPLIWDFLAISAYLTLSILFWYMGMIPDLATLRDRATTKTRRIVYGVFALGWRGSARHWINFERAALIFSAIATPLIFSVSGILGYDFAMTQLPGWHASIFPVYFVAGALFSGFSLLMVILVIVRKAYKLQAFITMRHLDIMSKLVLILSLLMAFVYMMEFFMAFYSGDGYEAFTFINRIIGPYGYIFWIMVACNVAIPQLFWLKRFRTSLTAMVVIGLLANVGMWCERFVIIITSVYRDFMPSSWGFYVPTIVDILTFVGTFGLFISLFLLFFKYVPFISMVDMKMVMDASQDHGEKHV